MTEPQRELTPREKLIARNIRRVRRAQNLAIRDAAAMIGWTPGHLSRVETFIRGPLLPSQLARAFNVDESEFLARCPHCDYNSPPGYTCQTCGSTEPLNGV